MRAREIISSFRDLLHSRGMPTGFEIHYPHKVELPDWNHDVMGAEECDKAFMAARNWAKQNCRGAFSSHLIREGLRPIGRRFEFEHEIDAAMFKLYWTGI